MKINGCYDIEEHEKNCNWAIFLSINCEDTVTIKQPPIDITRQYRPCWSCQTRPNWRGGGQASYPPGWGEGVGGRSPIYLLGGAPCIQTNTCENITFPRTAYVVSNETTYRYILKSEVSWLRDIYQEVQARERIAHAHNVLPECISSIFFEKQK